MIEATSNNPFLICVIATCLYFCIGWAFIFFVRFMEYKSGDPLWLGHKLFGKEDL